MYNNDIIIILLNRMRCKEPNVKINVSKYEKIIKENNNINELVKKLEELDLEYTKVITLEYLKTVEAMCITYKDIMDEKQKDKLEECKRELKERTLHFSEYEKIKDTLEVFMQL